MSETYYPRHSELDTQGDRDLDAAQERIRELEAQIRTVAERQREACAAYLRNRMKEANEDRLSVDYVRALRAAVVYADATPLVTEGEP